MAESNYAENIAESSRDWNTAAMTGDTNQRMQLYYQLIQSLDKADRVDIIVSFLMESGVKLLIHEFERALKRGAKIRILTGNYLGITQPSALYMIKQKLGDQVDLRFYSEINQSFHPKSYIFHYANRNEIYIGSSNISKSALTSGIEWNYRFSDRNDEKSYREFYDTFENLFQNHSIVIDDEVLNSYAKSWHRPAVNKDIERYDIEQTPAKIQNIFEPRGAQIIALYALQKTREEGADKALIAAATGVGKTYLAAFDSMNYKRILFVAHRIEILKQAAISFANVRRSDNYGFFNGEEKCTDRDVIFASVDTLGNAAYLNEHYFSADYFDYIVIDEFHHAVTGQYQNIINYFKPEFLLGLTATPERMDGKNIYQICDYNVPYEITLQTAINQGMLVPFHYYGIYDDTDYSKLHLIRGKYAEKDLDKTYIGNSHRHDLIYKYYKKYRSEQALGFCCSRAHAEEMAGEFRKRGVPAAAVYSNAAGEYSLNREEAIQKLKTGEIRVIFSVNMFNEGLDIPTIDMVLFLRPTESPVVFLQQLGRGLRKIPGKKYLNVLDFIGNYEKAGQTRYLLTDAGKSENRNVTEEIFDESQIPDDCLIDFDMRLIDLFAEIGKKQKKWAPRIAEEFYRIKDELGHRPSRLEMFTYMDEELAVYMRSHAKSNIFKRYLFFLKELGELTEAEEKIYDSIALEFLSTIENTNMVKVYKMPVLMAFYNHGAVLSEVNDDQLLYSWKEFFSTGTNWKDLPERTDYQKYIRTTDKWHLQKIHQMPVHFLLESGNGFFVEKEGCALALRDDLKEVIQDPTFADHMRDIIEYRTMYYYQTRYREQ